MSRLLRKPIVRGRRLAVEHVRGMFAAGDTPDTILRGYPWLEPADIHASLAYAHRLVGHERIEPLPLESAPCITRPHPNSFTPSVPPSDRPSST
ncbi:MAG: DUF433 domain-containing protein [Nitrospira sp.]|nr:DUF433 domain-containing protein [Nitrospira sp.]